MAPWPTACAEVVAPWPTACAQVHGASRGPFFDVMRQQKSTRATMFLSSDVGVLTLSPQYLTLLGHRVLSEAVS